MHAATAAALTLGLASLVLLGLAWAIGVLGHLRLINNYRRHPERYPDGEGLGRWMGLTLAAGGLSFGTCAIALGAGAIGEPAVGAWAGATGGAVGLAAIGGILRFRRVPARRPGGKGKG